jgi:DNA-binding PadR family transcriptional regulator
MGTSKQTISGNTSMLVLGLIQKKDMYGYEIIENLQEKSNNIFQLKAGTLYPLLHSLEEQDLVRSYESEVAGKIRKYYRITKDGKKYLKTKKAEWQEYSNAVATILCMEV